MGFHHALLQRGHARVAFQLFVFLRVQRVGQFHAGCLGDLCVQFLVEHGRGEYPFGLAGQRHQFADAGGDLLAAIVAEFDGAEHFLLRDFARAGFHHDDAVFGAGNHDVQPGLTALGVGGVGDINAIPHTNPDAAQHVFEREIGNGQRGCGADDRQGVRVLLGIGREDHSNDLGFVQEPFGEQRTDRPVDQTAGENFFFGETALAFDKAAGNLAGGVGVFAIVDGKRKESGSRFGLIGHASGDEDDRVPGANDNRAVRLFGHLTRFQGKHPAAQINFNCMNHCVC